MGKRRGERAIWKKQREQNEVWVLWDAITKWSWCLDRVLQPDPGSGLVQYRAPLICFCYCFLCYDGSFLNNSEVSQEGKQNHHISWSWDQNIFTADESWKKVDVRHRLTRLIVIILLYLNQVLTVENKLSFSIFLSYNACNIIHILHVYSSPIKPNSQRWVKENTVIHRAFGKFLQIVPLFGRYLRTLPRNAL